jgi:hypothetical protein
VYLTSVEIAEIYPITQTEVYKFIKQGKLIDESLSTTRNHTKMFDAKKVHALHLANKKRIKEEHEAKLKAKNAMQPVNFFNHY